LATRPHIVICGAGVIGAACAWFLSRRGARVTIVERVSPACAASGKSGGFLALDWCDGTPLEELARRSFHLHARLPEEIGEDWGYRRLDTFGGLAGMGASGRARHRSAWLSENVGLTQRLGTQETTAQVHPQKFTEALIRAAKTKGAALKRGNVTGLVRAPSSQGKKISGVIVDGEVMQADAVVIAMGPWSILASEWLPLPGVYGLKGHSIIFETGEKIRGEALFLEYQNSDGVLSPEIFPRPDGTTWCCAISSDSPLPRDPAAVEPDPGAMERLEALCRSLSPALADAKIVARQACFRPVTQDGLPLIGAVPGIGGVYVATGHSVWGILNAPATGEAVAALILDGKSTSVDLSSFSPSRLRPLRVPSPLAGEG
jgi:glycine/D-amino acid oxidase-like deaminating enzyme